MTASLLTMMKITPREAGAHRCYVEKMLRKTCVM